MNNENILYSKKQKASIDVFQADDHPQSHFIPNSYLKNNEPLEYQLHHLDIILFLEVIFNGKYLLAIGKNMFDGSLFIAVFKAPYETILGFDFVGGFLYGYPADCPKSYDYFDFVKGFVLNGGSTILFITDTCGMFDIHKHNLRDGYDLVFESLCILKLPINQLPWDLIAHNDSILAILSFQEDSVAIVLIDLIGDLSVQKVINLTCVKPNEAYDIMISSDSSYVGILTKTSEYMTVNGFSEEVTKVSFDKFHDLVFPKFVEIYFERINETCHFVLDSLDNIYDMKREEILDMKSLVTSKELYDDMLLSLEQHQDRQIKSCRFNNCFYFFRFLKKYLYIYDPFNKVILHQRDIPFPNFSINWFGDQIYFFTENNNSVIVDRVFKSKCLSLKCLCRVVIFENFSKKQLLNLDFGSPFQKLLFAGM